MRAFAEAYPDWEIVQQVVARLPWGHNLRLIKAVKAPVERPWYARQAVEHGWGRNVLVHQIESELFGRQGKAVTNFARTQPSPQSDLAQEMIKDPYSFDFLALGPEMSERELERGLLDHLLSWSLGRASPSWAISTASMPVVRTTTWPCSSTTCACAASS